MRPFIDDLFDQFEKIILYQEQFHSSKITGLKIDCRTIEFEHLLLDAYSILSREIHRKYSKQNDSLRTCGVLCFDPMYW